MILERLKSETHALHQRLEQGLDPLHPDLTLEQYRQSLQRHHALYAPLEAAMFAHPRWSALDFDHEARRKTPLLERDLTYFGLRALPTYAPLPPLGGWPEVLGTLYVLEGATLGGQIIGRMLERRWGLSAGNGASFHRSYGEALGQRWLEFRALLELELTAVGQGDQAVGAACATFELFERALLETQPLGVHALGVHALGPQPLEQVLTTQDRA